tara:strand:- start:76 stop:534 length:459 start_codon:yes stop_codon:yes gene_type:complete
MKVGKAIKKIEKYLGVKVQYDGCRYWFQYENEVGSFLANGHRGGMDADAMEADACNWHRRRVGDESCMYTDYHAGSFRDNLTQLLHSMKPPPCKFKAGQLVRGKQSKRAQRWGFAGLTGMVTKEASDSVCIDWIGIDRSDSYIATRDLELVS